MTPRNPAPILLSIRDDLTGKIYHSREELEADRLLHAQDIFNLIEPRIIAQVDSMPAEILATYKDTAEDGTTTPMDQESLIAQNIAVTRYKLGLD